MLLGIDHIVIVVNDLGRAAEDYARLGFTVVPGGKHPVGTHNVLISFADGSYVEVLAFYREAPEHRWWQPLQAGERLVDFCLQTDDLAGDTEKLRAAGVAINDPVPWSRVRPDGYELKWLLSLATGNHRGVAPFLIQDITPRDERIPRQLEHKNGITGIASLTIAVTRPSIISRWYETVLGTARRRFEDRRLRAEGLRFTIGGHVAEFIMPAEPESPLTDWLKLYGPSPYAATLRSPTSPPAVFDGRFTHGANLFAA